MNTRLFKSGLIGACACAAITFAGCNRQTRGNADAENRSRASTPAEGGASSTAGSAGQAKNFGDTRAKTQEDGTSPSASPTGLSKDAKAGTTGGAINEPTEPAPVGKSEK
jgi:hypothetical protein